MSFLRKTDQVFRIDFLVIFRTVMLWQVHNSSAGSYIEEPSSEKHEENITNMISYTDFLPSSA